MVLGFHAYFVPAAWTDLQFRAAAAPFEHTHVRSRDTPAGTSSLAMSVFVRLMLHIGTSCSRKYVELTNTGGFLTPPNCGGGELCVLS